MIKINLQRTTDCSGHADQEGDLDRAADQGEPLPARLLPQPDQVRAGEILEGKRRPNHPLHLQAVRR